MNNGLLETTPSIAIRNNQARPIRVWIGWARQRGHNPNPSETAKILKQSLRTILDNAGRPISSDGLWLRPDGTMEIIYPALPHTRLSVQGTLYSLAMLACEMLAAEVLSEHISSACTLSYTRSKVENARACVWDPSMAHVLERMFGLLQPYTNFLEALQDLEDLFPDLQPSLTYHQSDRLGMAPYQLACPDQEPPRIPAIRDRRFLLGTGVGCAVLALVVGAFWLGGQAHPVPQPVGNQTPTITLDAAVFSKLIQQLRPPEPKELTPPPPAPVTAVVKNPGPPAVLPPVKAIPEGDGEPVFVDSPSPFEQPPSKGASGISRVESGDFIAKP